MKKLAVIIFFLTFQTSVAKINKTSSNGSKLEIANGYGGGFGGGVPPQPQLPPNDKYICDGDSKIFVKSNAYEYSIYGYGNNQNIFAGKHLKCSAIANFNEETCKKCCQISTSSMDDNSIVGIIINEQMSKRCRCCLPRDLENISQSQPFGCTQGIGGGYGC
uniref:Uncharacterized protein n=1 Tax=Panagrolaimus sp. PS1159 TaxID=55785 RepID=A0AC35GBS9_9BILA